jgi:hypothetical protein
VTPTDPPPKTTGFWTAELKRLGDEQQAKTGRRLIHPEDWTPWHQTVADNAAEESRAQLAAEFAWVHRQQPRWGAQRTVAQIEVDLAAKRERDLARRRLSHRMAVRLSGVLEWSPR